MAWWLGTLMLLAICDATNLHTTKGEVAHTNKSDRGDWFGLEADLSKTHMLAFIQNNT